MPGHPMQRTWKLPTPMRALTSPPALTCVRAEMMSGCRQVCSSDATEEYPLTP